MKTILLIVFGETASGKDSLVETILQKSYKNSKLFNKVVRDTSRPKREKEVEGVEYNFLAEIPEDTSSYFEHNLFNGWFYGTKADSFDTVKINIMTGSIETYEQAKEHFKGSNVDVIGARVNVDSKIRMIRSLTREETPDITTICKRFLDESKQYKGKDNVYDILLEGTGRTKEEIRGELVERLHLESFVDLSIRKMVVEGAEKSL